MDFVDECLKVTDEEFGDACTRAMLSILDVASKLGTDRELTNEEVTKEKEEILNGFNQEEKDKLESFMYACIQIMGIYSEDRIQERRGRKYKHLIKEIKNEKWWNKIIIKLRYTEWMRIYFLHGIIPL